VTSQYYLSYTYHRAAFLVQLGFLSLVWLLRMRLLLIFTFYFTCAHYFDLYAAFCQIKVLFLMVFFGVTDLFFSSPRNHLNKNY